MRLPIAAATAAILSAGPVAAQQACADREELTAQLQSGYGEHFAGGGLQSETRLIEVWYSPDGGTWTILLTNPDGTSCILASGTNWVPALPSEQVSGTPS